MKKVALYHPKNKIRIVTAASLFDGHDAAINIMRRIIQASGASAYPSFTPTHPPKRTVYR